jgi:CHAT domain-containing protein
VRWAGEAGADVERSSGLGAELFDLPRSGPEVRAAVAAVGGSSRGLYGPRASEAALKRLELGPFGVVHFATHAVVNSLRPSRSAILLARGTAGEDGLLQPREIEALELSGKLVVLSACRSAGGPELRGEGPLSLARVFLGSGARAVLGTIWPVRDGEAAALTERFYARLATGETAATALAGAQRELLMAGAPPAAWAGFVLIGDGGVRLGPRPDVPWLGSPGGVLAVALALVLLAAGLSLRKP